MCLCKVSLSVRLLRISWDRHLNVQVDHCGIPTDKPITAARCGPEHCRLGLGAGVHFHPSHGVEMLSAAAWWLIGFEGIVLGMTNPTTVLHEVEAASVILLLIFMVAGIYFMKELLLFTFTKILLG